MLDAAIVHENHAHEPQQQHLVSPQSEGHREQQQRRYHYFSLRGMRAKSDSTWDTFDEADPTTLHVLATGTLYPKCLTCEPDYDCRQL